jgi:diguanylate cyclase (GGDEF)-like protein
MRSIASSARDAGRRVAATWHADLTDPVQRAALRARVLAANQIIVAVFIIAAVAIQPGSGGPRPWAPALGGGVVNLGIAVLAGVRKHRFGDLGYAVVLVVNYAGVAAGAASQRGLAQGQVAVTTVAFIGLTVFGALFLERRRLVVGTLIVAVGMLASVAAVVGGTDSYYGFVFGLVTLLLVAGSVRMLRDLALSALTQARRAEVTDPLTGLANRRGLERVGVDRWRSHARAHQPLAALVVDVDHFKRINDEQGHAAGDELLRRLGQLLSTTVRSDDVAVRLGGEEFLLLCSVAPGQGQAVAERIRSLVEQELAPVTVSIGIHETIPMGKDSLPASIWSAVDTADQALYVAKRSGRNRVAASAPPSSTFPVPG